MESSLVKFGCFCFFFDGCWLNVTILIYFQIKVLARLEKIDKDEKLIVV